MDCKECLHVVVCSKYIATGGTNNCKHFVEQKHGQKMDLPKITDNTQAALEAMGKKAHGEEC